MAFGHFLLGSHNFMVTALGLCVKWPLVPAMVFSLDPANRDMLATLNMIFSVTNSNCLTQH